MTKQTSQKILTRREAWLLMQEMYGHENRVEVPFGFGYRTVGRLPSRYPCPPPIPGLAKEDPRAQDPRLCHGLCEALDMLKRLGMLGDEDARCIQDEIWDEVRRANRSMYLAPNDQEGADKREAFCARMAEVGRLNEEKKAKEA